MVPYRCVFINRIKKNKKRKTTKIKTWDLHANFFLISPPLICFQILNLFPSGIVLTTLITSKPSLLIQPEDDGHS